MFYDEKNVILRMSRSLSSFSRIVFLKKITMLDFYYAFKLTNFPDERNSKELIVFRKQKILTNPQLREFQRTKTISNHFESLSTKCIYEAKNTQLTKKYHVS